MLFDEIREIIAEELDISEEEIDLKSKLYDDLGADNLAIIDSVMSLEDQYSVEIPDEALEEISTVEDFVAYIESKLD